ncbi:hypothetical protein NDI76_06330 [Halogeometricum sp. S1BR25-6]|uniref:Uncharacterized protein n=1 Tax=Halogeometricum salsisoli TaxID=2950536 RepID=A0ABU2GC15_9EURY|nr:hypothetical protein [Halogeometricum sp. S1BR25-6]MDS0298352.1 hypothetical protein [Halogeometricum sp. S1BR25-6]
MSGEERADGAEEESGNDEMDVSSLVIRALELSEAAMDGEDDSEVAEILRDLQVVVDEADELLDAVDLTDLPDAVDHEDADEVIHEEKLSEAITNADPEEAVRLRKLLAIIDIGELWDSVDVRDVWRNKREFEEALEELDETDDEDTLPFVDDLTDDEDDEDELIDVDAEDAKEAVGMGDDDDRDDIELPDEAYQTAIQSKLSDSVDEFREGLVATHDRIERLREENRKRVERTGQPDSRNPTAYSTLAASHGVADADTKYSTVPAESKYSNAPNRKRVYGSRFDQFAEEEDDA